ncbi:MAG: putative copper-exporting P-type ATPase A [Methanoregulaceae archaeon PtaB.Bin056]|jgi:Cd2+/Zn2+-exporting ATPase|nr:MAG: putative copper-exporting P-type ATPase A [Methanoregulaceae archaeon PtaB.Bin056]
MGKTEDYVKNSGSCGENHCAGPACGYGQNSHHEESDVRKYVILAAAGVLLAGAISGEYIGLPEIAVNILAILSALCTGIPILVSSIQGLIGGRQNVCEFAGIAIIAAIIIGEYLIAAEVGLILSIGEIAEEYAYQRSRREIEKIAALHPDHGLVERDGGFIEVPVDDIEIGDVVLVRPGDVIPSDGVVLSGSTSVDESCLTGESVPNEKQAGYTVYSGSININGAVRIEVSKKNSDSTYSRIVGFVREAESRRPPTYPFIDTLSSVYTPLTLAVTALVWIFTGSIERSITIIIVACPCALLLSTPSAVISAIGAGARRGILIKSGLYLEEAGKIDNVLFDKTGTLTSGRMRVKSIRTFGNFDAESVTALASAAENGSEHPVARAIKRYAEEKGVNAAGYVKTNSRAGLGIRGESDSGTVLVGNANFLRGMGVVIPSKVQSEAEFLSMGGASLVFVSLNDEVIGFYCLEDSVRDESANVIEDLKKSGIDCISIVSGDRREVAESVADACGIDRKNVYAGVAPGEKKAVVEGFQSTGDTICFVGDGVNDAPALAQANIGVAMGSRENTVAIETSHVVLLRDDLRLLLGFMRLGRITAWTIRGNVVFALSFTFLLMALAFFGIVHPAGGAVGHQIAVLAVLANSALIPVWMERNG